MADLSSNKKVATTKVVSKAVAAKPATKAVAAKSVAAKPAAKAVAAKAVAAKPATPAVVSKSVAAKPAAKAVISASDSKKRVVFEVNAESGADVFVAGTFNDWSPEEKPLTEKGNGIYSCALMLAPGTYEYKFRINNTWAIDQDNPNFTRNDLGTLNSVLVVL